MTTDRERFEKLAELLHEHGDAVLTNGWGEVMIEADPIGTIIEALERAALAQPVTVVGDEPCAQYPGCCCKCGYVDRHPDQDEGMAYALRAAQPDEVRGLGAVDLIENLVLALELQGHADMSIVANARAFLAAEAEKKRT